VDGGGTKTQIVLLDEEKQTVAEGLAGASNPLRVGIEAAVANISSAVDKACDTGNKNRGDIVSATLGLAGVRREDLRQRVRESFSRNFGLKKVNVYTDAEIALYGATFGKAGLVVIAGTGSICIGQNERGERATAGGWGPLAGDEGGGAGISRRALQAIAKASDGRGKPTELSEVAIEYFRAGRLEDLSVAIYAPQIDNARIAGFARFVIEAAQADDEIAVEILREAAGELALAANTVIHQLKLERKKFPIARVGGIFRGGDGLITEPFMEKVRTVAPKAFLIEPLLSPPAAAALLALKILEMEKDNEKNQFNHLLVFFNLLFRFGANAGH
jgi:N-acetylglucosamine kinase-like BadF-type ATPase